MTIETPVGKFKVTDNLWCVNSKNDVIFVWNTRMNFKKFMLYLGKRVPWTEKEKETVIKHFQKYLLLKKLPGKRDIQNCIDMEIVWRRRTCRNVKDFIRNTITTTERKKNSVMYKFLVTCLCLSIFEALWLTCAINFFFCFSHMQLQL